ncbi:deoxyuridine 5'-triphosphate nucleotidohydrolase-like [Leptosomus discolor]
MARSAGVDMVTAVPITIEDKQVHVVPSTANGPLGNGLSALLLGRSSTSRQGILVIPGVIDADYTGNTGIMVQAIQPSVHIPEQTRLAQLVSFRACVPHPGVDTRGDGAFGSTGSPHVYFTVPITKRGL